MKKSFYYIVEKKEANEIALRLISLQIPFFCEPRNEHFMFAFPDLPVRQYGQIRNLFGSTGHPF